MNWRLLSAELGRVQYDKRVRHTTLYEGDRVLVRNLSDQGGPGKLRPYWEQEIYVVTKKRKDMPGYEVRPENGGGRSRVLHRNLLLPCSYLPVKAPISTSKRTQKGPRKVTKRQPSTEGTSSNADDDMPNLTPHQFEERFESTGATVSEGYEHAPCQQNRTLILFMLMTQTRSKGPKIAVNRWLLQMMTLMLWMRDSRGIHNERPDPYLG